VRAPAGRPPGDRRAGADPPACARRAGSYIRIDAKEEIIMTRVVSFFLGCGLIVLWLAGLSGHATGWLTWLDVLAALCAFGIAAVAGERMSRGFASGAPIALASALAVLWIIGLTTRASSWLTWWTFAFACAFLLLGLGGAGQSQQMTRPRPA
jgi:hypothetical protein